LEALLAAEALAMQAGPRPHISANLLFHVREALKARRSLRFRYGEGMRHVDPWGLLLGRIPYLVGPKVGKSTPALWRLDRIDEILVAEPDRGPPDDFDLKSYAARSFGAFQEAPEDIVLRFSPDAAANARRFLFHPTQVFVEDPDGALIVNFRAGGFLELVRHLFTWGADVEILAPSRLRALMLEELRNSLSAHKRCMN
ncbi:WYL domain-containing protein, partial [Heyndrickxia sporothermodurans]